MEQEIAEFLNFLSQERALSDNTIVAYKNDLSQFLSFVGSEATDMTSYSLPTSWEGVKPGHINAYFTFLQARSYADATIARKLVSLKSYFVYLKDRGSVSANPADSIPSMGVRRTLPRTITPQEVDTLLAKSRDGEAVDVIRDRAMLWLLYTTGMRVTELVRLDIDDLHLDELEPYVRCIGRGGRPRALLILPETIEPLLKYLDNGRARLVKNQPQAGQALFLNQRGERLTRQGFWLILKGYAKNANLGIGITPHTLRHSFAAHMLKSGKLSLPALQRTLGHSSITSTQVYIQVADESTV